MVRVSNKKIKKKERESEAKKKAPKKKTIEKQVKSASTMKASNAVPTSVAESERMNEGGK